MTVDSINAMLGIVVLVMLATTAGFFICYFLVKKEYDTFRKDKDKLWLYVDDEDRQRILAEEDDKTEDPEPFI